jgi:hypothetical protein
MYFGIEVNHRTKNAEGVFHLSLEEMRRLKAGEEISKFTESSKADSRSR